MSQQLPRHNKSTWLHRGHCWPEVLLRCRSDLENHICLFILWDTVEPVFVVEIHFFGRGNETLVSNQLGRIRDLRDSRKKDGFPPETAQHLREKSGKLVPLQRVFVFRRLTERLKVLKSLETSHKIPPESNTWDLLKNFKAFLMFIFFYFSTSRTSGGVNPSCLPVPAAI